MKVGICWAGSPAHPDDRKRSTALREWRRLLQTPGVTWYSLQVGCTNEAELFADVGINIVPSDAIKTFADLSYVLTQLDLVIAVDTAVVHLAGAMSVPCWVLIAVAPDWRWMLGREDSPWYPSLRLFRQKKALDWTAPLEDVAKALRAWVNADSERKAA